MSTSKSFGMIIVASLLLFTGQALAEQTHVVQGPEREGGSPYEFLANVEYFRAHNVRVVVTDRCKSSCTLYTALLRDNLICARPSARFIFHRYVWANDLKVDAQGLIQSYRITGPIIGPEADALWMSYPLSVRKRIMAESPTGLPRHGEELTVPAIELVPRC